MTTNRNNQFISWLTDESDEFPCFKSEELPDVKYPQCLHCKADLVNLEDHKNCKFKRLKTTYDENKNN